MLIQSFLPNSGGENRTNALSKLSTDKRGGREQIKHLLVGSPKVVTRTIHSLHILGYAEVREWSRPISAAGSLGEPGEVVSILIKQVVSDT